MLSVSNRLFPSCVPLRLLSGPNVPFTLDFRKRAITGPEFLAPVSAIGVVLIFDNGEVGIQVERGPVFVLRETTFAALTAFRLAAKLKLGPGSFRRANRTSYRLNIHPLVRRDGVPLRVDAEHLRIGKYVSVEVSYFTNRYYPVARGQLVFENDNIVLYNSAGIGLRIRSEASRARFMEDTRYVDEDDHPYESRSWTEHRLEVPTEWGRRLLLTSGGRKFGESAAGYGFADRLLQAAEIRAHRLDKRRLGRLVKVAQPVNPKVATGAPHRLHIR